MFLGYPLLLPKHTCKWYEKNSDLLIFQLFQIFFFKSFTDLFMKLTRMCSITIMKYRSGHKRRQDLPIFKTNYLMTISLSVALLFTFGIILRWLWYLPCFLLYLYYLSLFLSMLPFAMLKWIFLDFLSKSKNLFPT